MLSNHLGSVNVLKCPSDRRQIYEQTGSSYSWNSLLNGQDAERLTVLSIDFDPHQIPVFFDKEAFHNPIRWSVPTLLRPRTAALR